AAGGPPRRAPLQLPLGVDRLHVAVAARGVLHEHEHVVQPCQFPRSAGLVGGRGHEPHTAVWRWRAHTVAVPDGTLTILSPDHSLAHAVQLSRDALEHLVGTHAHARDPVHGRLGLERDFHLEIVGVATPERAATRDLTPLFANLLAQHRRSPP